MKKSRFVLYWAFIFVLFSCNDKKIQPAKRTIVSVTAFERPNLNTYVDTAYYLDSTQNENTRFYICRDWKILLVDSSQQPPVLTKVNIAGPHYKRDTFERCTVTCSLHKEADKSTLQIAYYTFAPYQFKLSTSGPANGIGTFSSYNADDNDYIENFQGGQTYRVDSVRIKVDEANVKHIKAKYRIWLSNANVSKIIYGTIDSDNAIII